MRQSVPVYVVPSALRDLVLLDMVALTGSTSGAGEHLHLSQPTVSRRCRRLAAELGMSGRFGRAMAERTGDSICLRLLRKGLNRHRWDAGVLRLGGRRAEAEQLAGLEGMEWVALDRVPAQRWATLLRRELLDGVVLRAADPLASGLRGCYHQVLQVGPDPIVVLIRRHPMIRRLLDSRLTVGAAQELAE